jgi:hypothetical protein
LVMIIATLTAVSLAGSHAISGVSNTTATAATHAVPTAAPAAPPAAKGFELRSRTLVQGPARAVCFFDGGIILGTGGGIAVFPNSRSLRNPAFLAIDGEPYEIIVAGNIAYVAANNGGLRAIDLSDPAHPSEIFEYQTAQATACAHAGMQIFLTDVRNRFFIFDLDNPREPRLKETRILPFPAVSLAADGALLAVIDAKKAEVFRVLPDGTLQRHCVVDAPSEVKKGLMAEGMLYLLTEQGEVLCWDIAKEKAPRALKTLQIENVVDIAVSETSGILLTRLGFLVPFELERKTGPGAGPSKSTLKIGKAFDAKTIQETRRSAARGAGQSSPLQSTPPESQLLTGLFTSGKRFALISAFEGVRLCELDGAGARVLDRFATRGFAIDLVAAKGLLYVANAYDGVRIGSVDKNGTIDWIGHVQTEEARDVALARNGLVIADGAGGIKIADVTDPRNPRIIGRHQSPYFMSAVVVQGERAYCAGGLGGVEIVDIADARRPRLVWREKFSEVRGIWVDGRYLYFADGFKGLRIFLLGGNRPVPLSVLDTPGWSCDCFVAKNDAYVADGGSGILIAHVSDKKKPRVLGSVSVGTIAREIHLLGKTLFVASNTKGIAAVEVSNPRKPAVAAWYQTVNEGRGVFADDDFVYLASGSGGVYIFKYRD